MNKISKYAKKSAKKLDITLKEKRELELQFIDHMTELYNNHKLQGFSEEESIDYAINTFKNDNIIDNNSLNKLSLSKFYPLLFFMYFLVFISIYIYVSRLEVLRQITIHRIIPFRTIYAVIYSAISNDSFNISRLTNHLILFLAFIPIGFFIPLLISKYKAFIPNLKIYLCVTLILEIIKIPFSWYACIDYFLLHLLSCLVGYGLFKLVHYLISNKFNIIQKKAMNM